MTTLDVGPHGYNYALENNNLLYLRVSCFLLEPDLEDTGNTGDTSLDTFGDTCLFLVGSAHITCITMLQAVNKPDRLSLFIPLLIVRIASRISDKGCYILNNKMKLF